MEAFEYGWEHWDRISRCSNPAGYLFKAGARYAAKAVRRERRQPGIEPHNPGPEPWVEPKLEGALERLTRMQRTCVVLVDGFEWTYQEVADLLDVRRSTVQRHVTRAMEKLRSDLGVRDAVA
jgi:DNA-directed RNA polymerase specialized sigma24 family protein